MRSPAWRMRMLAFAWLSDAAIRRRLTGGLFNAYRPGAGTRLVFFVRSLQDKPRFKSKHKSSGAGVEAFSSPDRRGRYGSLRTRLISRRGLPKLSRRQRRRPLPLR